MCVNCGRCVSVTPVKLSFNPGLVTEDGFAALSYADIGISAVISGHRLLPQLQYQSSMMSEPSEGLLLPGDRPSFTINIPKRLGERTAVFNNIWAVGEKMLFFLNLISTQAVNLLECISRGSRVLCGSGGHSKQANDERCASVHL